VAQARQHPAVVTFGKILIANRGEIACRVIRSARAMGIRTVAVYSDPDRDALHARMADEAVRIGPAPAAESYLSAAAILEACRQTGAEAVHPGYGFLAENAAFAGQLETAGITFIGPPAPAIAAMGDKLASKQLAIRVGVNTIPGSDAAVADADAAVRIAAGLGYPVMLKASAGGGGKGMRIACDEAACREGFERAASEARAAFGDARLLVEKYIERPRHIEIQVLADAYGHVIHLGERECSIQRRHQKVIEEAPSPLVDPAMREAMGAQAVGLARAVGYVSAGTVEFVVGADRRFYFLEMNTRLQVEHPVTELVTGIDLVEWMIRIAAGERLPFAQADITLRGAAIEARVYAEDPARAFLPSIGRVVRLRAPPADHSVRLDAGIEEGGEVSIHYDPMIAKLATHGDTRAQAIERLRDALDGFYLRGPVSNVGFLQAIAGHPRFAAGDLSTDFLSEAYPDGFAGAQVARPELFVAAAAVIERRRAERAMRINGQMPNHGACAPADWVVVIGADEHPLTIAPVEGGYEIKLRGERLTVLGEWRLGEPLFRATVNGAPVCIQIDRVGIAYRMLHRGCEVEARVLSAAAARLKRHMIEKPPPDLSKFLLSPMPGLLVSLVVAPGQAVKRGEPLAVVEAMKMENVLRAPRDGTVAKLLAAPGDGLAVDQPILEFE
jgi:propionyl-CoA carboxylase alpha chain